MIQKIAQISVDLQIASIGLNRQMFPVFLGLLLASTIVWIFLSRRLYDMLMHGYPRIYEELGSPKMVIQKTFATNFKVIMFLFRRSYELTDDVKLIQLCQGLRYIFIIYLVCFLGCLILLLDKIF
jgi:hypothetical protein